MRHAVQGETAYINFNHPVMQSAVVADVGGAAGAPMVEVGTPGGGAGVGVRFAALAPQILIGGESLSAKERHDHDKLRRLVDLYFSIVKLTMADQVPKVATLFMVNRVKDQLNQELVQALYRPEEIDELVQESDDIVQRRKATDSMMRCLTAALVSLNRIAGLRLQ